MTPAVRIGAAVLGCVAGAACAARRPQLADYGIPRCPAAAAEALLSADALQCWFDAEHGRWRILSHVAFQDTLVVEVETADLRDADAIARRFAAEESEPFSEILVYAQTDSPMSAPKVRRVRWTRSRGFEVLEFSDTTPGVIFQPREYGKITPRCR